MPDKVFYEQEYVKCGKTVSQIAKELGTYTSKVRRELQKLGFPLRNKSETQKLLLRTGKVHPTKGRVRSDEEKYAISKSLVSFWENLDEGEYNKAVEQLKQRWQDMPPMKRKELFKKAGEAIRKAAKEGSQFEKFLLNKLIEDGYAVDYHVKHLIKKEELEIDIYLPEVGAAVEFDGISHVEPIWGDKALNTKKKSDSLKNGLLLGSGIHVIRIIQKTKKESLKLKYDIYDVLVECIKKLSGEPKIIKIEVNDDYSIRVKE